MIADWVSVLAYPNLFGIKGSVVVVVVVVFLFKIVMVFFTGIKYVMRNTFRICIEPLKQLVKFAKAPTRSVNSCMTVIPDW
jgi:hypothetical protein